MAPGRTMVALGAAAACLAAAAVRLPAQAPAPRRLDPPRFADPERRARLGRAFAPIDRAVADFMARERVPGAAWAVLIDGELAHLGTAGVRDVTTRAPVDASTVFRIASMTKSFTAMAILKLRDEGRLALDDPADRHVPEIAGLEGPTADSPRVTIRHLLSHAQGFPEDNPWGDQQLARTEPEFTAMLENGIPFSNPPGVAFEYSNYGFAILGRIVTNVSKVPYRDYVAASILRPLGMTATTLEPASVPVNALARGYRWEDERWKEEPPLADGAFGAMGGMLTSPGDLARYVGVFMRAWPPGDDPEAGPIRRASLREMQQIWRARPTVVTRSGSGQVQLNAGGYGFGLGVSETCGFGHVVAHSGGLPGFGSQMRWLPEYGVGLIAMANRTYTGWGGVFDTALDLLRETGGLEPRRAQPSAALSDARAAVTRLIQGWDDAEADRIAAGNLFVDLSRERRRRQIDELGAKVGACRAGDGFTHVENALRGSWTLPCERGQLHVSVTLAPSVPPRVQFLQVSDTTPPARPTCPR